MEKNYKECPNCQAVTEIATRVCEECCYEFFELPELPTIDVELETIEKSDVFYKEYSNYKKCKTFSELCKFQKENDYKFGWVRYKCEELGIEIPSKYQKKSKYN